MGTVFNNTWLAGWLACCLAPCSREACEALNAKACRLRTVLTRAIGYKDNKYADEVHGQTVLGVYDCVFRMQGREKCFCDSVPRERLLISQLQSCAKGMRRRLRFVDREGETGGEVSVLMTKCLF